MIKHVPKRRVVLVQATQTKHKLFLMIDNTFIRTPQGALEEY